ncbi:MAG: hypothetical protein ACXVPL_07360, partial [Actinomycetota bacterium]
LGDLGTNLGERMSALLERDGVTTGEPYRFSVDLLPFGPQVRLAEGETDAAIALHDLGDRIAVHVMRYDYDEAADRVPPLERLVLEVRLPEAFGHVVPLDPAGRLAAEVAVDGDVHRVTLSNVGVYGIAVLSR